jgi:hypothetical protein
MTRKSEEKNSSMKTKFFLLVTLALILLVLFFLIFIPTAAPSKRVEPPGATLQINKQTQEAVLGSYCWTIQENFFSAGALCADMGGISAPSDPLILTQFPTRAQIHFEIGIAPDNATMAIIPVTSGEESYKRNGVSEWNSLGQGSWSVALPLKASIDYPFQGQEFIKGDGLYIVSIVANWNKPSGIFLTDAAWGDTLYGFLIEVGAGNH